ncbi:MAG: 50S ribosomal protein L11 methyltransferase, partial [Bacteroidales bacterium]|nr:50S ribosomal protein L11 methyltransferase [Bacteroidales bacterium]
MKYIEVNITLGQNDPFRDLLVDALGNEGPYDSFVETPSGLKAYVQESLFDEDWLKEQLADIEEMTSCSYTFENLPDKNWNEEWEKQHKPVLVEAANGKRVWVRAPFHEHRSDVDYEIEIEPKMSFGTAHHQTTYMMLSYLTELELAGQRVLDMGCGTAVRAILAKIRGADYVEAIDIDEWAYNNAIENAQRNGVALNVR